MTSLLAHLASDKIFLSEYKYPLLLILPPLQNYYSLLHLRFLRNSHSLHFLINKVFIINIEIITTVRLFVIIIHWFFRFFVFFWFFIIVRTLFACYSWRLLFSHFSPILTVVVIIILIFIILGFFIWFFLFFSLQLLFIRWISILLFRLLFLNTNSPLLCRWFTILRSKSTHIWFLIISLLSLNLILFS